MAAAAPSRTAAFVLAGLVLALVALTALVAAGTLTRADQFSVTHLMPWLRPGSPSPSGTAGYYRPFTLNTSTWPKILDSWTYPCSLLISGLVVIWAAVVLWRRYGPVVALAPAAAWIIGNGIEVIGKGTITKPAVYATADGQRVHVVSFDDSFPSGHMIRGVIVAFAIAIVFTRLWKWALFWVILVAPALVLQSAHTLTDVVGGAIIGLILLVLMVELVRSERTSPGSTELEIERERV
jgi:membrane-associated phospholipid phosphatase